MRLRDRVALVTGGARGLGAAVTARLAGEGARVVVADVDDAGPSFDGLTSGQRALVEYQRTDVRDADEVQETVAGALARHGRLDILVNNAAVFTSLPRAPLEVLTTGQWQEVLAVNVIGVFHCIKAVTPPMRSQGGGKIINVASDVVFKGLPMLLHYVASKGAVLAMTRAAARELGPDNITVNAVAPGYMRHGDFDGWDPKRDERVIDARALRRTQTPQDVVGAVAFLASSDSDFITGQTLVVDGGEVVH